MKKNHLSILIFVVIAALAAIIVNAIMKPRFDSTANPYDLQLDSLGKIAPELYCSYSAEKIAIPLKQSKAIAVDSLNTIYISGDNRIVGVNSGGRLVSDFSTPATATALAVTNRGQLVVAFETHVAVYATDGTLLNQWPPFNKKSYITSLAVNNNRVYLADADDALVYEYTPEGGFIRTYGTKGDSNAVTTFILPSYFFDLAVAPDATLWVTNNGKHKVVNFQADGSLRSSWGETSAAVHGFSGCCNPSHIAILNDGSFITAEKGIVRIKKYTADGQFECAIAGPEHFKKGALGLDVVISSDQKIMVLEPDAALVHMFSAK